MDGTLEHSWWIEYSIACKLVCIKTKLMLYEMQVIFNLRSNDLIICLIQNNTINELSKIIKYMLKMANFTSYDKWWKTQSYNLCSFKSCRYFTIIAYLCRIWNCIKIKMSTTFIKKTSYLVIGSSYLCRKNERTVSLFW